MAQGGLDVCGLDSCFLCLFVCNQLPSCLSYRFSVAARAASRSCHRKHQKKQGDTLVNTPGADILTDSPPLPPLTALRLARLTRV